MNGISSNSSFHSIPLQNLTTEGWLELFLSPAQKRTFSKWTERVQNKSLTHRLTSSIMDYLSTYLPENVAPNVVTLAGFSCLGQAWYIVNKYGTSFPVSCTWFAVLNILLFFITHSIDVRHAERTRQQTALGHLFKYVCDTNATVFLVIVTTYCLGGTDVVLEWYCVQATQLVLFTKHLSAFHRHAGLRYNVLTGPGEVIISVVVLLCVRGTFGLGLFLKAYEMSVHPFVAALEAWHEDMFPNRENNLLSNELTEKIYEDPKGLGCEAMMTIYYAMYITALIKCWMLDKEHGWTRFGLSASLLMRFLPAVFLRFGGVHSELTILDVICDGFFMALLTSDIMLAKMAGREIHPWVVLMSVCAVLSHSTILTLVVVYYIAVFTDLCSYLNMPLLTVCKNVYCDGVYDLCHIGHKTLFRNALTFGNRLFVGVVGDKDASSYKRPPIMTHDERCAEVEACKSVTKVIPNSPCFGLTKEFIDEHQIHVVAYGQEYLDRWPNPDDDVYYGYVRKIGIARPMPRHDGLSTSDLIARIQKAQPASKRNDS